VHLVYRVFIDNMIVFNILMLYQRNIYTAAKVCAHLHIT